MSTVGSAEFGAFLAGRFGDHALAPAPLTARARAAFGDHGFAALLAPPTPDAVAEALALCCAEGWPVAPVGAATWPPLPPGARRSRPPVLLSTARLDGITEHEPADLVIGVQAGLPLHRLDQALRASRQWLPLDPPAANGATIGAVAALSAAGPLRAGHGTPRDMALGVEIATGDGRLIRFGGRVVKNVAGYDGVRLTIGSRGTLGIITGIFLRVRGTPRADRTVALACGAGDDGFRRGAELAAAIRGSVACDALELISPAVSGLLSLTSAPTGWTLLVRILGGAAAVDDGLDRVRAVIAAYNIGGQAQKMADVPMTIWNAMSQLEADASCALRLTGPATLLLDGIEAATTATRHGSGTGTDGGTDGWRSAAHAADGIIRLWRPAAEPRSGNDVADCVGRVARATANSEWTMRCDRCPPQDAGANGSQQNTADQVRILSRRLRTVFDPAGILSGGTEVS